MIVAHLHFKIPSGDLPLLPIPLRNLVDREEKLKKLVISFSSLFPNCSLHSLHSSAQINLVFSNEIEMVYASLLKWDESITFPQKRHLFGASFWPIYIFLEDLTRSNNHIVYLTEVSAISFIAFLIIYWHKLRQYYGIGKRTLRDSCVLLNVII